LVVVVTFPAAGPARRDRARAIRVSTLGLVTAAAVTLGGIHVASPEARPAALTVFAAADLAFALKDLATRFERAHDTTVTLVLGSTGHLSQQIAHGAPADVLFAANERFVDDLVRRGAIIPTTRVLYAQGRIVLATRRDRGPRVTDLARLADPRVRRIAIANPQHAPYGMAAEQALRATGVWGAIAPRLVFGDNVRHALQFLETGAVDVAIVALSLVNAPGIEHVLIDAALHAPLNQVAGVVTRSAHPGRALAFIQYVNGPDGRPLMKRYGFLLPGEF
jgi:molybdate transport system substrate-binding protein